MGSSSLFVAGPIAAVRLGPHVLSLFSSVIACNAVGLPMEGESLKIREARRRVVISMCQASRKHRTSGRDRSLRNMLVFRHRNVLLHGRCVFSWYRHCRPSVHFSWFQFATFDGGGFPFGAGRFFFVPNSWRPFFFVKILWWSAFMDCSCWVWGGVCIAFWWGRGGRRCWRIFGGGSANVSPRFERISRFRTIWLHVVGVVVFVVDLLGFHHGVRLCSSFVRLPSGIGLSKGD